MTTDRVLVDTSAWVVGFRKTGHPDLKEHLRRCITSGHAAICPIVILELLRGCKTTIERDGLKTKLESLDLLPITPSTWERAYELGFSLGRQGLTVPTSDLIIATVALEHDAVVLHQDQHYEFIRRHVDLRTKHFG